MPPPFLGAETNANTAEVFGFYIISTNDVLLQSPTFTWIVRQGRPSLLGLVKPSLLSPLGIVLGESCFAHHGYMEILISFYLLQLWTTQKPHELCLSALFWTWDPVIRDPCLPKAPRHSSTHLNLFSFGVSLLWDRQPSLPTPNPRKKNLFFFLENHHLPGSHGGGSVSQMLA